MILGYIDPGQGMLIWQAIVSAFVGFLFYMKKSRDFILNLVLKVFRRQKAPVPRAVESKQTSTAPVVEAEVEAR